MTNMIPVVLEGDISKLKFTDKTWNSTETMICYSMYASVSKPMFALYNVDNGYINVIMQNYARVVLEYKNTGYRIIKVDGPKVDEFGNLSAKGLSSAGANVNWDAPICKVKIGE